MTVNLLMASGSAFKILVIITAVLFYRPDHCYAQDSLPEHFIIPGIAFTPAYDNYNPVVFNLYMARPSLKEYQFLIAADPFESSKFYYRIEGGINWLLTERNKYRNFQVHPVTMLCYTFRKDGVGSNYYSKDRKEVFLSAGLNTNIRIYRNLALTTRVQFGAGEVWDKKRESFGSDNYNMDLNIFYYAGIRLLPGL